MDIKRDRMSKNGYCQGNRCRNYNPANKHQVLNILHMSSKGELQSLCPKHPSVETHYLILDFNLYMKFTGNKTYLFLLFSFSRMRCSHHLQSWRCSSWLLDRNWPNCLKLMVKHSKHTENVCESHHMMRCCHHDQTHKHTAEPKQIPKHLHQIWVAQIFIYGGCYKTSWQSSAYRFCSPVMMLMKTAHGCSDNKAVEVSPTVFILIRSPEYLVCFVAVTAAGLSTEHQATSRMLTIMSPVVFFSQRLPIEWTIYPSTSHPNVPKICSMGPRSLPWGGFPLLVTEESSF